MQKNRTTEKYGRKVDFKGELRFVRLGQMKVSPIAQRELRQHRVDYLYSVFDPDKLGLVRVSHRDGYYWLVDGQHRVSAAKRWLGKGWEDVAIECWVMEGLTEKQEADYFLSLADVLSVNPFQKFKIGLTAGRDTEVEIAELVESVGLKISQQDDWTALSAVSTLVRSYKRDGREALRKALVVAKNGFGEVSLTGPVIDGFGLLCRRYNGVIEESVAIESLSKVGGGYTGFLNMAKGLKAKTGQLLNQCVAATAVIVINRRLPRKKKLPGWFKE